MEVRNDLGARVCGGLGRYDLCRGGRNFFWAEGSATRAENMLMRPINEEARKLIDRKLSLVDVAATGFWFCAGCQRITEVDDSFEQLRCVMCRSVRVNHYPAIFGPDSSQLSAP